jgi:hypothetical protein
MTATIFDSVVLSPEGERIRQLLSPSALDHLAKALGEFILVSDRPVAELADRLLCGFFDAYSGRSGTRLQDLIVDVLTDDDTTTPIN